MSKFRTTITVDINALVRRLPPRSAVTQITLRDDMTGVDVEWENDDFKTPYTVPVDWQNPPAVPEGVTGPTAALSGHPGNFVSPPDARQADARTRKKK
jgi:hypothetical protein